MDQETQDDWDVIVIGGALAGAATASLILQRRPATRLLILERSAAFGRRVGESTVEISAFFLGHVLGLNGHLNREHLAKQGLRFWFANDHATGLRDCSETGPGYNVRFPGYQVDRAVLDEEILRRTTTAGASLARPATVHTVDLHDGGRQVVEWSAAGTPRRRSTARWIVDASGFAALLARRNGWLENNDAHPTASCWARWSGVRNLDDDPFQDTPPSWRRRTRAVRFTSTNHLVGRGWWSWWIPLRNGDTSVGIVFDQRTVDLPPGPSLAERLRSFLLTNHPAARELLDGAEPVAGDVHFRRNLAYRSRVQAGNGFVLVGDAAAFLDPFYSPGMDWISFTATGAAALVDGCLRGRPAAPRVERHNRLFSECYDRWFEAIYRDKYDYLGDQELMTLAFRLDLGLYYLGVVARPFRDGPQALETPPFAGRAGKCAARLLATYNRRFASIARARLHRHTWGRRNHGRYVPFRSYELDLHLPRRLIGCLATWGALELREGWRTWFHTPARTTLPAASPLPVPQPPQPLTAHASASTNSEAQRA